MLGAWAAGVVLTRVQLLQQLSMPFCPPRCPMRPGPQHARCVQPQHAQPTAPGPCTSEAASAGAHGWWSGVLVGAVRAVGWLACVHSSTQQPTACTPDPPPSSLPSSPPNVSVSGVGRSASPAALSARACGGSHTGVGAAPRPSPALPRGSIALHCIALHCIDPTVRQCWHACIAPALVFGRCTNDTEQGLHIDGGGVLQRCTKELGALCLV